MIKHRNYFVLLLVVLLIAMPHAILSRTILPVQFEDSGELKDCGESVGDVGPEPLQFIFFTYPSDLPTTETLRGHYLPILGEHFVWLKSDELLLFLFRYESATPAMTALIKRNSASGAQLVFEQLSERATRWFPLSAQRNFFSGRTHFAILFFEGSMPVAVVLDLADYAEERNVHLSESDRLFMQFIDTLRVSLFDSAR